MAIKLKFSEAKESGNKYAEGIVKGKITDASEGAYGEKEFVDVEFTIPERDNLVQKKKFFCTPAAINELLKLYSQLGLYEKGGADIEFNKMDLIGEWFEFELIKGDAQPETKKDGSANPHAGKRYLEIKHYSIEKCEPYVETKKEVKSETKVKAPFED